MDERQGDRNSSPMNIAVKIKKQDPNMKNIIKSAGLFLNESYSNIEEYLYKMQKSNMVSTENSPK